VTVSDGDRTLPAGCSFAGESPSGGRGRGFSWRARWAAIGAAVAVVAGTGGVAWSGATNAQLTPSQTLISPCRIMDTRSGPNNVGPRATPLNGDEIYTIQVTGLNGNCNIPAGTSGVVMNVTIVGPGSNGYLTVFPGGSNTPTASNLNYVAGQAPTPNQVTVALNGPESLIAPGQVSFFASGGPVNVIADIAGYTTASRLTNPQLTQNRWDRDLAKPATVDVGPVPTAVAFDGTNVWVVNEDDNTVSVVDPAINDVIDTVTVGSLPSAIAFDGTNVWVTNAISNNVTRINAATGAVVGSPIAVGSGPTAIAFDGADMWVANGNDDTVTQIKAASGTVIGSPTAVGTFPNGMAFDGANIWVTNFISNNVTRIDAATGAVVGSPIAVGTNPIGVAFDGTNMWVANNGSDTVTRIDAATGVVVGSPIGVGVRPSRLAFDGTTMWVSNTLNAALPSTVTRIDVATGTVIAAVEVGQRPVGMAFDGTNVWVANSGSNTVSKLRAG